MLSVISTQAEGNGVTSIGIIGVGEIGRAIVDGLRHGGDTSRAVFLSPLTTHYRYLATLTSWAEAHGIAVDAADHYVRGLFQGVGRSLSDESRSLGRLAADHETPNGSNERIRTTWFTDANAAALGTAPDDLLTDLR